MTENNIIKYLNKYFANHEYRLYNVFIFEWESDFFCISSSGYTIEVEIKISRSDFKADFKKTTKHIMLSRADKNSVSVPSYEWKNVSAFEYRAPIIPNKFYYCCPEGLIAVDEIPEYAGLLYYSESIKTRYDELESGIIEVKPAKFLHKNKPDISKRLLSKYYFMYQGIRSDYIELMYKYRELQYSLGWDKEKADKRIEIEQKYYEPKLFE
jgi:hypothetical protein